MLWVCFRGGSLSLSNELSSPGTSEPLFRVETCLALELNRLGFRASAESVFEQAGISPIAGTGCGWKQTTLLAKKLGFGCQAFAGTETQAFLQQLPGHLRAKQGALIWTGQAFALVSNIDVRSRKLRLRESGQTELRELPFDAWTAQCASLAPGRQVAWLLQPEKLTDLPVAQPLGEAEYARHIAQLHKRLPPGFHITLTRPFVVIGDEPPGVVERRARDTVRWAVDRLEKSYFAKPPTEIVDIWLFRNKSSYEQHCWELFGDRPGTPFGYYSPKHRALIMNISTGGGTLVHEIVHPYMAANFPTCPAWFNEGLASLYEQSRDKDGQIIGLTNWRLRGLQAAIGDGKLVTFRQLTHTTRDQFYSDQRGIHYAQARYLCYYLQERGKLKEFYDAFRARHTSDPTGYQTLVSVLGERDMNGFQERWEAWVMELVF